MWKACCGPRTTAARVHSVLQALDAASAVARGQPPLEYTHRLAALSARDAVARGQPPLEYTPSPASPDAKGLAGKVHPKKAAPG